MHTTAAIHAQQKRSDRAKDLYFTILSARVAEQVVHSQRWDNTPLIIIEAVEYRLYEKLEKDLFGDDQNGSWVDIERIENPIAWAKALFRRYVLGVMNDVRLSAAHASKRDIDSLSQMLLPQAPDTADVAFTSVAECDIDVAPSLYRAHGLQRIHVQAEHVRQMYQLPRLQVPFTTSQKRQLLDLLTCNPHLIDQSITRVESGAIEGSPLDRMWASYSREQLLRMQDIHERCILVLVQSALSPRPRPGRGVLQAHRRQMKQTCNKRGWSSLMNRLQAAWLAEYFAVCADYGFNRNTDADRIPEPWTEICEIVAEFVGCPLGTTPGEIDNSLCGILASANPDSPATPPPAPVV